MLSKVNDVIQGNVLHAIKESLPPHIEEQVALRAHMCSSCLNMGKCPHCHCPAPKLFYAPSKKDPKGKWAEFLSASQWESLKNNIEEYYYFLSPPSCLTFHLRMVHDDPDYKLYYNSDHTIALKFPTPPPPTYLPLSHFGYEYFANAFDLSPYYRDLLASYLSREAEETLSSNVSGG